MTIAYYIIGEGPALLVPPAFVESFSLTGIFPEEDAFYDQLGAYRTLVAYDMRGNGLSERNPPDMSHEAMILDMEAVVKAAGLSSFAIYADTIAGPRAVALAAAYPDRIDALVMYGTFAAGRDVMPEENLRALAVLCRNSWAVGSQTLVDLAGRQAYGDALVRLAQTYRESTDGETTARVLEEAYASDVTELLPRVLARTLVVHRRDDRIIPFAAGRKLASGIRGSRVLQLPGDLHTSRLGDSDGVLEAVDAFLAPPGARGVQADIPTGTALILFADIADSTALTERLGDAAFRAKARDLDAALRTVIRDHAGTPIEGKLLGDGVLAVLTSARQAIEAALACGKAGDHAGLPLHLGLHAGDVIREENNVYGGAVNIASRISGLSAPGEVLVSDIVRGLARTSSGVTFEDRGNQRLKGVSDAVRVWAVKPADSSSKRQPFGGVKRPYPDHLTSREVDVLRLIAAGRTNLEISNELVLSERTVARHITNIYGKIGARGKADATMYAVRHGLASR